MCLLHVLSLLCDVGAALGSEEEACRVTGRPAQKMAALMALLMVLLTGGAEGQEVQDASAACNGGETFELDPGLGGRITHSIEEGTVSFLVPTSRSPPPRAPY
eukprot:SAG31_NODE_2444_length_5683_cov_2.031160_2_plen_103_part_00